MFEGLQELGLEMGCNEGRSRKKCLWVFEGDLVKCLKEVWRSV